MGCKRKVLGNCVDWFVDPIVNPARSIRNITGVKIPTSISIGGRSVNLDPNLDAQIKQAQSSLRDLKNAGRQAEVDWKNAGRGEVGKFVSTAADGAYTMTMALPRAISTGDWEHQAQKFYGGSRAVLSPLENMIGKNQGWQDKLRNEDAWYNKWTGNTFENFAGQTRGHAQMESSGTLLNEDRVAWQQLSVKAAAVVAAIFGGAALAGGGAAPAGGGAATGTVTLGEATVTTVGVGSGSAAAGGGAAAAASTPWWGTALGSAAGGIGTAVAGGLVNRGVASASDGIGNYLDDLIGIGNGGDGETPSYGYNPPMFSDPTGNAGSYGGDAVSTDFTPYIAIGATLVIGYLAYRKFA